jgi:hypothetical protein
VGASRPASSLAAWLGGAVEALRGAQLQMPESPAQAHASMRSQHSHATSLWPLHTSSIEARVRQRGRTPAAGRAGEARKATRHPQTWLVQEAAPE